MNKKTVSNRNQASRWRIRVAQSLGPLYASNEQVACVLVGGSTARGHADRYSDLEVGIFWHHPPTEEERRWVVQKAGADLLYLYPYDLAEEVWCDDFMVGRSQPDEPKTGLLVEAVHYTTEFMQRTLDAVLKQYDPDELKQNLISGVAEGFPLAGTQVVDGWKAQADLYPRELAVAIVRKHATIDHFWRWEMWLERGDNRMMVYQAFSQIQQKLLHVLLALNRKYYFGFKWLDTVIERLQIMPPNFSARLKSVYDLPPADAARELAALVEQTYDLVQVHLPEVDVEWLRRVFRHRRPVWEHMPPAF